MGDSLSVWSLLALDILEHDSATPVLRRAWSWPFAWRVILFSAGFHCVALHRLAHAARPIGGLVGKVVSALLSLLMRRIYACDIAATAELGPGLILPHPLGIVIGPGVVVGARSWVFQHVTLGGAPGRPGAPVIGEVARIYAGAVVSGAVNVGDNVVIGANTVITRDLPDRSLARLASSALEVLPLPERLRDHSS